MAPSAPQLVHVSHQRLPLSVPARLCILQSKIWQSVSTCMNQSKVMNCWTNDSTAHSMTITEISSS